MNRPLQRESEQREHHDQRDQRPPTTREGAGRAGGPTPAGPDVGAAYTPSVDVCDCGADVRIVADVPGSVADSIDVSFDDGVLSIAATVPPRTLPGALVRQEYGVGDYRRSFRLGEGFDASQITADLARGVLSVRIPRLAAVRPRKVEVRAG